MKFNYDKNLLQNYIYNLEDIINKEDILNNKQFIYDALFPYEIKANNDIEGLVDDINNIENEINNNKNNNNRIINLYKGYKYILNNKNINKETLKELYDILSNNLLDEYSINNMNNYYRNKDVYILKGKSIYKYNKGIEPNKINYYMDDLLNYINNDNNISSTDKFIKSQIIHYYFVYIHPYFDVNGRTSRTLSLWYLINNNEYPYIIFNRAISFDKSNYNKSILKSINNNDINYFLKYMIERVENELEKEILIKNIINNSKYDISKEEYSMIDYFLNINGNLTILDLINKYKEDNKCKNKLEIYNNYIIPLIEKEIFILGDNTSKYISTDLKNKYISLNKNNFNKDRKEFKTLKLKKYLDK